MSIASTSPVEKQAKLSKLLEIEGFATFEEFAEKVLFDSVSPAICCNPDRNYTCEMEPDQHRCDQCRTNTMMSALVLADMI